MAVDERNLYRLLTIRGNLPEFIDLTPSNRVRENLSTVKNFILQTDTRKAEFLQSRLARFKGQGGQDISMEVKSPIWREDDYYHLYMMPAMRATLKVGVKSNELSEQVRPGTVLLSGDVETLHNNSLLTRPKPNQPRESVAENIAELLSREKSTFVVRSSIAGLRADINRGVAIIETHQFIVDSLTREEVGEYVMGLSREQLERAPGGILWPHPLIISHINQIDGIKRGENDSDSKMISLLNSLLNIPDQLDVLIRFLNQAGDTFPLSASGNLHKFISSTAEKPLLEEGETFVGNWSEIVVLPNGDLLELSSIPPDDYEAISQMVETNFRYAQNFKYLQVDKNQAELMKFIEANSPKNIKELLESPVQLCALMAKINGEVVGFRAVRKRKEEEKKLIIADGRRLHVVLGKNGLGIGTLLLERSEQISRQQGCDVMEVHATGESHRFFESHGYELRDKVANSRGVFQDKPTKYFLMTKDLNGVI